MEDEEQSSVARVLTVTINSKRHASDHFQSLLTGSVIQILCPFVCRNEHEPYKEATSMNEPKDQTIALNVRLKPSEPSAHPRATNYTNVGVVQGIAYVDFGFIEPTLLAAIAKTAKDGKASPK